MRAAPACASLLDELLPAADVAMRHTAVIDVPRAVAAAAIDAYEPATDSSRLVRLLFWLRGVPPGAGTLRRQLGHGAFALLGERPEEEIVAGVTGRFWMPHETAHMERPADASAFRAFARPGWAKAALSFRLESLGPARTRLVTETRVQCVDRTARWCFRLYWSVIGPFAALIRREMLRGITRRAEAAYISSAR